MHDKIGEVRTFKGLTHATCGLLATAAVASSLILMGCETTGALPSFRAKGFTPAVTTSTTAAFSWSGATTIDVVTSAAVGSYANNDELTDCTNRFNGAGCMQPPAITYSDSRWFVGFFQDYLSAAGVRTHFSAFVNMTDLVTGLFGTALGALLNTIDDGSGTNPLVANAAARYVRFANFANGDVIAVFLSHNAASSVRTVWANIYSASTNSWGAAVQLGTTNAATDLGFDMFEATDVATRNYRTHHCKPSVATAGDGSAMVSWCEQETDVNYGNNRAITKFARYASGVWSSSESLVDLHDLGTGVTTNVFQMPALHGTHNQFPPAADPARTIAVGDTFTVSITRHTGDTDTATVTAVASGAAVGQFNRVVNATGVVQVCDTLLNIATALLSTTVTNSLTGATTRTLVDDNISIIVNPDCVNGTVATNTMSVYYNRGGEALVRNIQAAATANIYQVSEMGHHVAGAVVAGTDDMGFNGCASNECYIPPVDPNVGVATGSGLQLPAYEGTAMTEIAGDSFGNYAMVRSMPVVVPKIDDISSTGVTQDASGLTIATQRGRMLVGHEWVSGTTQWKQRDSAVGTTGVSDPVTNFVSDQMGCHNGTDVVGCSVRNPKFLMSDAGRGLILFHRAQYDKPSSGANYNSNRLWFATYGVGTGFSPSASILDEDVFCSTSSTANDTDVCETGTYSSGAECLNGGEAPLSDAITQMWMTTATAGTALTSDLPPIAAAMNRDGEAVIAFHKKYTESDGTCSDYHNLQVVTYDPFNGFGSIEVLDDDTAHTMHSQVAVTENGTMAVVWETYDSTTTTRYVYLKTRTNGVWSSAVLVNDSSSLQTSQQPMWPAVGINDEGEIVVSYSYTSSTGPIVRRQYVNYYYYH